MLILYMYTSVLPEDAYEKLPKHIVVFAYRDKLNLLCDVLVIPMSITPKMFGVEIIWLSCA